jgi:hypothetical protein
MHSVPRTRSYRGVAVDVTGPIDRRAEPWSLAGGRRVAGTVFTYRVIDRNLRRKNEWIFQVQVPNSERDDIVVRPQTLPNDTSWAGLDRTSILFVRARRPNYRGRLYCKVSVAYRDHRKKIKKKILRFGERTDERAWRWLRGLGTFRAKSTATTSKGSDQRALVAVVRAEDHKRMIRLFFGAKVWPLKERSGASH